MVLGIAYSDRPLDILNKQIYIILQLLSKSPWLPHMDQSMDIG